MLSVKSFLFGAMETFEIRASAELNGANINDGVIYVIDSSIRQKKIRYIGSSLQRKQDLRGRKVYYCDSNVLCSLLKSIYGYN